MQFVCEDNPLDNRPSLDLQQRVLIYDLFQLYPEQNNERQRSETTLGTVSRGNSAILETTEPRTAPSPVRPPP